MEIYTEGPGTSSSRTMTPSSDQPRAALRLASSMSPQQQAVGAPVPGPPACLLIPPPRAATPVTSELNYAAPRSLSSGPCVAVHTLIFM